MLDAQSVSISIGTAIAAIPNRANALRRDILSIIVVSLSLGPAASSLLPDILERLHPQFPLNLGKTGLAVGIDFALAMSLFLNRPRPWMLAMSALGH